VFLAISYFQQGFVLDFEKIRQKLNKNETGGDLSGLFFSWGEKNVSFICFLKGFNPFRGFHLPKHFAMIRKRFERESWKTIKIIALNC